jgi:hypothetical protein
VAKRDARELPNSAGRFSRRLDRRAGSHRVCRSTGYLEVFEQQVGSEEPAQAPVSTLLASSRWWRRVKGYDIPAFDRLHDFKTWDEEGPPKGTLYHYPPRGDQIVSISAAPAPPKIANQIYAQATVTKMVAHCTKAGGSINKAIDWAASELEGFMRT